MGPAGPPEPGATPDASAQKDSADPADHDAEHEGVESHAAGPDGSEHDTAQDTHAVAVEDAAQQPGHELHPSDPHADHGPVAPTDPTPASSAASGQNGSDPDSQ